MSAWEGGGNDEIAQLKAQLNSLTMENNVLKAQVSFIMAFFLLILQTSWMFTPSPHMYANYRALQEDQQVVVAAETRKQTQLLDHNNREELLRKVRSHSRIMKDALFG
jgi:hypothetical protein